MARSLTCSATKGGGRSQENGWNIVINNNIIIKASNSITGCSIEGNFVSGFVRDKLEELKEENHIKTSISFEEVLEKEGLSIICESPFEIEDKEGNIISGECALWLKEELIQKFSK